MSIFKKILKGGALGLLTGGLPGALAGAGLGIIGSAFGKKGGGSKGGGATAEQFYQSVIRNGGFLPGQKDQLATDVTRQLGAQTNLQRALLNERLAAVPGAQGTAFADARYNQLVRGQQDATQNVLSNLNQLGIQNQFNAANALYGGEQAGKERKAGLFGSVAGGLLSAGGELIGAKIAKSSISYKKDVRSANPDKLLAAVKNLDVKKFKYKEGLPEADGKDHLGPIAEESPDEMLADDKHIDIPSTVGMLLGAVRALSDKVDKLSGVEMTKGTDGIYRGGLS